MSHTVKTSTTSVPKNAHTPVSRKRDRHLSTEKLLRAALDVFSKVGYDAATTKSIAARAGLNESLIQRYFNGKAGLLSAVTRMYADKILQSTYPAGNTVQEEILGYLTSRYQADVKNPDFIRVAFHRALTDTAFFKSMESHRYPVILVSRLKALQNSGKIKPSVDVKEFASIILGQSFMHGIMDYAVLGNKNHEHHYKSMRLFVQYITQGILKKA